MEQHRSKIKLFQEKAGIGFKKKKLKACISVTFWYNFVFARQKRIKIVSAPGHANKSYGVCFQSIH